VKQTCDVCVFGAGPAGAATAARLADLGAAPMVLDRPSKKKLGVENRLLGPFDSRLPPSDFGRIFAPLDTLSATNNERRGAARLGRKIACSAATATSGTSIAIGSMMTCAGRSGHAASGCSTMIVWTYCGRKVKSGACASTGVAKSLRGTLLMQPGAPAPLPEGWVCGRAF
jgi:choline dehydrogenase-like flavoprotein